jgi:hypothetical protein
MAKRTTPRSNASDGGAPEASMPRRRNREATDERTVDPGRRPEGLTATGAIDASSNVAGPSDEDIRRRAYERYLQRGGGHGMDFEDWLEAERELKRRS